ncbi:hypothetical protein GCM10027416_12410 [Okibacterium endophyticum]
MRKFIAAATVLSGVVIGLAGLSAAHAVGQDELAPRQVGEHQFYSEDQIDAVWTSIVEAYPEPLPEGVEFPKVAPSFLHPDDETPSNFEVGLAEQVAAKYWRCAWLDSTINAGAAKQISAQSEAERALSKYYDLPEVAENFDEKRYEATVEGWAEQLKTDPISAEYEVECSDYSESSETK